MREDDFVEPGQENYLDKELLSLIMVAGNQIQGLQWTQKQNKKEDLEKILELRTKETKETIQNLIKCVKEKF